MNGKSNETELAPLIASDIENELRQETIAKIVDKLNQHLELGLPIIAEFTRLEKKITFEALLALLSLANETSTSQEDKDVIKKAIDENVNSDILTLTVNDETELKMIIALKNLLSLCMLLEC